jgi:hypothetical protein
MRCEFFMGNTDLRCGVLRDDTTYRLKKILAGFSEILVTT